MSKSYDYSCGYPIELGAGSTETNKSAWVKAKSEFERIYRLFNENLKYYDSIVEQMEAWKEEIASSFEQLKTDTNKAISDLINTVDTKIAEATKDMLTKSETKYITEVGESSDGKLWYRKWSDGWIEQGGYGFANGFGGNTVTLAVSFSNTDYTVVGTKYELGSSTSLGFGKKAVDSFLAGEVGQGGDSFAGSSDIYWYACGY